MRPTTDDDFQDLAIFPASDNALWDLFTDEFVANLQDRIGEPRTTIDPGSEADGIGFTSFLAAEILDSLVQAGLTVEGRPLDLTQVSTGGLQRIYSAADEVSDSMTRRANDLRRKARLIGGTYNPLIAPGQVIPGEPDKKQTTILVPAVPSDTTDINDPGVVDIYKGVVTDFVHYYCWLEDADGNEVNGTGLTAMGELTDFPRVNVLGTTLFYRLLTVAENPWLNTVFTADPNAIQAAHLSVYIGSVLDGLDVTVKAFVVLIRYRGDEYLDADGWGNSGLTLKVRVERLALGAQGERGPRGPKGDKGDKGDKGEPGAGYTFEDEGTAISGTFSKVNFKGTAIQAAADPQDATTLDVTVTATNNPAPTPGTGSGGDISDAEFAGMMRFLFGAPIPATYVTSENGTAGQAVVSTNNTPKYGTGTFVSYNTTTATNATLLADNILAGDGLWVTVRKALGSDPTFTARGIGVVNTTLPTDNYPRIVYNWSSNSAGGFSVYYQSASARDTALNGLPAYAAGETWKLTITAVSDGSTGNVGKYITFTPATLVGNRWTSTGISNFNSDRYWKLSETSTTTFSTGATVSDFTGGQRDSSGDTDNNYNTYKLELIPPGGYSTTENAAEIIGTVAGVEVDSTDPKTVIMWVGDEVWTTGEDQWGQVPNGPGSLSIFRGLATRAGMRLPGVPANIFGTNAAGRLGIIPTADLAAHIVGPESRFFALDGTFTQQSALPTTARKIRVSGSGNTRTVNITGSSTASDLINAHLGAFLQPGYRVTVRLSSANSGGWTFTIGPTVNHNTIANGGIGFTATTVSGTPPTGTSTYKLFVDGDVVHWDELYSQGLKPVIKAGDNITVTADDTAETLTIASTASGGGSTAWADITGKPSTFTPPTATNDVVGGLETATQAEADGLSALDKILTPGVLSQAVYEALKSILTAGTGVTVTNSDSDHTSTLAASGGSGGGLTQVVTNYKFNDDEGTLPASALARESDNYTAKYLVSVVHYSTSLNPSSLNVTRFLFYVDMGQLTEYANSKKTFTHAVRWDSNANTCKRQTLSMEMDKTGSKAYAPEFRVFHNTYSSPRLLVNMWEV